MNTSQTDTALLSLLDQARQAAQHAYAPGWRKRIGDQKNIQEAHEVASVTETAELETGSRP